MISPIEMWKARVKTALFCDDIRREMFGKDIIIGVYSDGITVPSFPASVKMCAWLEYVPEHIGDQQLKISMEYAAQRAEFLLGFRTEKPDAVVALYMPGFNFLAYEPGNLRVSVSQIGGQFTPVAEVFVQAGPPPPPLYPNSPPS